MTNNLSFTTLIVVASGALSACAMPVEDSQDEAEPVETAEQALVYQQGSGSIKQISGNGHTCRADASLWGYGNNGTSGTLFDAASGYGYMSTQAKKISGANAAACLAQVRITCCAMPNGPCIYRSSPVGVASDANSGATTAYCTSSYPAVAASEARAGIYGYGWTANW